MKITLIALGVGAGCLLFANSALAGACTAQIDTLQKQLQSSDAGMGPTGNATGGDQVTSNPVSPSGTAQAPTTPATGTMNDASQNKATSAQDVQSQNAGAGTLADQATGAASGATGNASALTSLQRAQQLDQAGDEAGCMNEITKAQGALKTQ